MGFCVVVSLALGLMSFLMFSAWGRFSDAAWGNVDYDDAIAAEGFIAVDMSDFHQMGDALIAAASDDDVLERPQAGDPAPPLPEAVLASLQLPVSEAIEDFGPLPKYLSDYESIVLSAQDDGTLRPGGEPEDDVVELTEVGVAWHEHIVKTGETLSDIALAYGGLTAQDILRANGLKDANRLASDQLLLIPNGQDEIEETLEEVRTRQARIAALREKVEPLKVSAYVVVQGDSLWSISNSQNIELDTLVGSNTFKSSATLRPGAVLRIPNQEGIFYTLRGGEKIDAVCKRYGVDVEKLRKVNHTVDVASLKAGDEVFLPGARPEALTEVNDGPKKAAEKDKAPASKNAKAEKKKNAPKKAASRSYRWPVMGRINSPFGWRRHPITRRSDFHTGIDIKAGRGTSIRSARAGKVAYSGWMGGYGKVIVVEHADGQSTLYAHCSTLLVPKGSSVTQGQNIAQVGTTGRSTGPHLHFEVRNGNSPVNPLKYLK